MNIKEQIKEYITSQPEPKCSEMKELHRIILKVKPKCKLWFLDGKDEKGKIVSNPSITFTLNILPIFDASSIPVIPDPIT